MGESRKTTGKRAKGLRESGGDAFELVVAYLKQETLGPLKELGRFLVFGIVGSIAIAVGLVLMLVGVLRLLQGETGSALNGNWSWVPYLAVVVIALVLIAVAGWRVARGPARRRLPEGVTAGGALGGIGAIGGDRP
ncbi:MAG: hypothetical protein ACYDEP_07500 [Acidimicrobiales bacterium]